MSTISESRPLGLDPGELALLAIFWVFSGGIFVWSFSYAGFTGLFPRIFATAVLVGTTLLLTRNYLPESVQNFVTATSNIQEIGDEMTSDDVSETLEEGQELEPEFEPEELDRPLSDTEFVTVAVVAYFGVSYLIGMLWASPLFAIAYALWYRKSWKYTVIVVFATFAIPYAFYDVLNLQIMDGYIHEVLGLA